MWFLQIGTSFAKGTLVLVPDGLMHYNSPVYQIYSHTILNIYYKAVSNFYARVWNEDG